MLRNVVIAQFLCLISFTFICILFFYQSKAIKRHLKKIKLLEDTIDTAYSSVIFCDTNNKFLYVNKTFEAKTGYKMRDLIGRTPSILKSNMHPESFYAEIKNAIKNNISWENEELISRTRNGNLIYEKVRFAPFFFEGKLEGYMAIKLDRTKEFNMLAELTQKNEQIKIQSSIDKLTGFGNYFALTEMIEAKKDGIVISISIKNYKMLRFFYQTKVIDAMLKAVANTLKLCVDTYSINAELFRFQDDAFYIWYQGDDIVRDIGFIKEYFNFSRMNIEIDGKFENLPGIKITLGVSLSNDTPQTNRLMQSILANQQASDSGNEIYYYLENDAIEMRYYKNQLITELIEYALENDKVIVECQGIFNVQENETEAKYYEVLVRIVDQNGKIRYPGEFLEIAMKTQLYLQITKKVIALAFDLVKKYPDYTFSINLSSSDLTDPGVREILDEKLESCPDPSRVCFEMLESEELSDYAMANEFIKRAKKYGCKISIDDFGSGYSNYYRILELDIDNIKIDGSIIKKLPTDENARVLVETIVSFARIQGYKIVAEFVSNEEILEYIKKFGISYAQGFLLGKPHQM
ncbi:bifunctional diguanylate cyclase/phosphodiesterase [Campylobacter concisus]|uniref:bifunctional diguanylate cyclase/phosphodiesterase n=1 Tax=Campylobacter concisus TaxID=199 RepID=UPI002155FD6E|nr:GGDEF domain-containing phosphodiesterase [Campylobacter concisus]